MVGIFLFLYLLCESDSHNSIKLKILNFIPLGSEKVQILKLGLYN